MGEGIVYTASNCRFCASHPGAVVE